MICRYCHQSVADAPFCGLCGKRQEILRTGKKRGNGQGTAYKRGKTWEGCRPGYQFIDEGGLHRVRPRKGGFATKKEALEWASSTVEIREGSPKLIELWEQYKKNDLPKLSANRQSAYKTARKKLEPLMGREIHTLTLTDLQDLVNEKCPTFYTARDVKTILKAMYKRAMIDYPIIQKNLAEFIVLPQFEEAEATPFTEDELATMWKAYDKGDYFIGYILLMCYTGMMPAELMACKKSFVDTEKQEIFGCGAKTKVRKKSVICFPDIISPVITNIMTGKGEKLLPFGRESFYTEYYACLDRVGLPKKVPYSCRHTFGTEAVKLGVHPEVVKKMLRHSTQRTQERYTHLTADAVHEAMANVSRGTQVAHKEG